MLRGWQLPFEASRFTLLAKDDKAGAGADKLSDGWAVGILEGMDTGKTAKLAAWYSEDHA